LRTFCDHFGCGFSSYGNIGSFRRWSFFHRTLGSLDDAHASLNSGLFLGEVFVANLLRQLF
jgi:hypothetical protein